MALETNNDPRPKIALTMGDAGGIGPELVVRLLGEGATHTHCRPLVVGDPNVIGHAARLVGSEVAVAPVATVAEARFRPGRIDVLLPDGGAVETVHVGEVDAGAGRAAAACLTAAARLGLEGEVQGVVSAPMNKQALHLASVERVDEADLLADVGSGEPPLLVGVFGRFWTTCVTLHVPLGAVPALVTRDRVLATIRALARARAQSVPRPRLAVAGLNPHAGESGLLGREEIEAIQPAVEAARADGIDVDGPLPADTIFPAAQARELDGVVCMYHDQANIARKLSGFAGQATLFCGWAVPVATTAHGTAFDRAGQGTADPRSISAALDAVIGLALGPSDDARR